MAEVTSGSFSNTIFQVAEFSLSRGVLKRRFQAKTNCNPTRRSTSDPGSGITTCPFEVVNGMSVRLESSSETEEIISGLMPALEPGRIRKLKVAR